MTHLVFHHLTFLFWEDFFLKILCKAILDMSLTYVLEIFVKLVPFITGHNSSILSHTEVFVLYSHSFKIVHWPPSLARAGRKVTQVLFITECLCHWCFFSCYHPHALTRWAFVNIVRRMHIREAFNTRNKNRMHTEAVAWESWKVVTQVYGFNADTCVLQACNFPSKMCHIQPALTLNCKHCGPWLYIKKVNPKEKASFWFSQKSEM